MTVRLTVQRSAWEQHVAATAAAYGAGLVPVVKGTGYGFGRALLHDRAAALGAYVGVGSVHELAGVPAVSTPVVLTPALGPPAHPTAILTVAHPAHVAALAGRSAPVMVKLASSMRRYGATPSELPALVAAVADTGLTTAAFALHLPLAGDDAARLAEIEAWLPSLPAATPLWVSHLTPASFRHLQVGHPGREFAIRVGTALWHGLPKGGFLQLSADVLHTAPVHSGDPVGYFQAPAPCDGTLVAIGAGTAHGIAPLDVAEPAQRSPFHFARRRLTLLEVPHMHTSLVVVPAGDPCPAIGDRVDVQRPLTSTWVDEVEWA
jgi:alanine racemase